MSFADFPEQQLVTDLLQRSLARGRLGHAYLLTGDDQEELEAVARTLAKTLNCQNPKRAPSQGPALDCCDACPSCRHIESDNHPDVQWVRPESKLRVVTIDQVRDVMQTVHLKPTEADFKVAVMVSAERLSSQAANAFLKTLEEPPPRSILILTTTNASQILDTILSRCLRLNFSGEGQLKLTAEQAGFLNSFTAMASEAGSLMGRYRLLGLLLAELGRIKTDVETIMAARSPLERFDDVDPKLRDKWEDELKAAQEAEYRHQRHHLLGTIYRWLRDIWLLKLTNTTDLAHFPNLAESTEAVSKRITTGNALSNLQFFERTQALLQSNVQESLALEVGFLKLNL